MVNTINPPLHSKINILIYSITDLSDTHLPTILAALFWDAFQSKLKLLNFASNHLNLHIFRVIADLLIKRLIVKGLNIN